MNDKKLVADLVKLQILCMRWVERNTNLRCDTHRDMDRILMENKLTLTYSEGVDNVKKNILRYCKNEYLLKSIAELEDSIKSSSIKNLKFGLDQAGLFSKKERELDEYLLKRKLYMITGMVGIKRMAEIIGVKETTIKQACQQERLMNTVKIGSNWTVHIPECRAYWNKPEEDQTLAYYEFEY